MIVDRVEGNSEQHQVLPQAFLKLSLEHAKVIRRAITVFGQRASGVDKIKRHHFAGELAEVNRAFLLVREREIGNCLTHGQPAHRPAQSFL